MSNVSEKELKISCCWDSGNLDGDFRERSQMMEFKKKKAVQWWTSSDSKMPNFPFDMIWSSLFMSTQESFSYY